MTRGSRRCPRLLGWSKAEQVPINMSYRIDHKADGMAYAKRIYEEKGMLKRCIKRSFLFFGIDIGKVIRTIVYRLKRFLLFCGFDFYVHTDDRRVLQDIIFPYFAQHDDFSKILFVGCQWYTRGYNKVFKTKTFWTLEIDPSQSKYGSKRHIVDSLANIRRHFGENELDLIFCTGVFGSGMDVKAEVEDAFQGCFESLREGGVFVFGWNDVPKHRPFPLEECESLKLFTPYVFPPLSSSHYLTDTSNRHIYDFYTKT